MDERSTPERDISGVREPARNGARPQLQAVDPATAQPGKTYEGHTRSEAHAIAARARTAFEAWRTTGFAERAARMREAAAILRRRAGEFAELMTAEMGKTRTEGLAEIEKCAF